MVWVRVDDHFDEHPKFAKVGPLGVALWVAGLAYANRNLTDGFIPWSIARTLVAWQFLEGDEERSVCVTGKNLAPDDFRSGRQLVDGGYVAGLLVDAGIWGKVEGGYQIHDYDKYQPTRGRVEAERERNAARAANYRRCNAGSTGVTAPGTTGGVTPAPYPVPGSREEEDIEKVVTLPVSSTKGVVRGKRQKRVALPVAEFTEEEEARINAFSAPLARYGFDPPPQCWAKILDKYGDLDLEEEAIKIAGWLKQHSKRQCSPAFVLNWLGKAFDEAPLNVRNPPVWDHRPPDDDPRRLEDMPRLKPSCRGCVWGTVDHDSSCDVPRSDVG